MSSAMLHRLITATDLAILHRLYMAAENNRFLDYDPIDVEDFRSTFDALVRQQGTYLVIDGSHAIATYRLHFQAHRCAHVAMLSGLAIDPALHRRGMGSAILQRIFEIADLRGVRRVEILVEADNAVGLRFYEKNGFIREGIFRGAFRRRGESHDVDEIAMARRW
jgi:RimJ/RimL family protein N-acetyltransferase